MIQMYFIEVFNINIVEFMQSVITEQSNRVRPLFLILKTY